MCYFWKKPPQVDYGQGSGVFNPSARGPVYRQVERARGDADFARRFAEDILYGKQTPYYVESSGWDAERQAYVTTRSEPNTIGEYVENTLNKYKSWVPQTFGDAALRGADGNWYKAHPLYAGGRGVPQTRDFTQGGRITDADTLRLLNDGHYAFSATGTRGTRIYIPWAEGFTPAKGGEGQKAGRAEAGDAKRQVATGEAARGMATAATVDPGNVMGGRTSLLGGGIIDDKRKNLLG